MLAVEQGVIGAPGALDLEREGACRIDGLAASLLGPLVAAVADRPDGAAGLRLTDVPALGRLLGEDSAIGRAVAEHVGMGYRPVRAVLFDKNDMNNWTLGWHQDRTIAVRARKDVPGFGSWSIKQGIQHVEPPFDIIAEMVTVRIHLDPVDEDNAPLLVAPGTHRLGRVPADQAADCARAHGNHACPADRGDVWIYRTPILHASERARHAGRRRRVLQVDYAAQDLPAGLEWLGIGQTETSE